METNHFALYNGKIVYVPDVPKLPIKRDSFESYAGTVHMGGDFGYEKAMKKYSEALQSAIASGIEVENQDEVKNVLMKNGGNEIDLHPSTIYPLQCRVEIIHLYPTLDDDVLIKEMARVTFEQPEKNPCSNCKETVDPCACMRNKCVNCGQPVGNITFSLCDDCWNLRHSKPEAAGQEQERNSDAFLLHLVDVVACFVSESGNYYATSVRVDLINEARKTFKP